MDEKKRKILIYEYLHSTSKMILFDTEGGTPFVAMHKYAPISFRLTFESGNTSPSYTAVYFMKFCVCVSVCYAVHSCFFRQLMFSIIHSFVCYERKKQTKKSNKKKNVWILRIFFSHFLC